MKAKVDQNLCIGCGICEGDLPEVFLLGDAGVAEVIMDPVEAEYHERLKQVVLDCPTTAISIDGDEADDADADALSEPEEHFETTTDCCGEDASDAVDEESNHTNTERKEKMKVKVVEDLCIGCGICEGIAPEVFSLETEPYAVVLLDPVPEEFHATTREAAEACPEAAIVIEE